MGMPKHITLINDKTGQEKVLDFQHARRFLLLGLNNKTNIFRVKGKYTFNGKDIVRHRVDQDSKGEAE